MGSARLQSARCGGASGRRSGPFPAVSALRAGVRRAWSIDSTLPDRKGLRGADPNKRRTTSSLHSVCTVFASILAECIRIAAPLHAVCIRAGNLLPTLHRLCSHFASNGGQKASQNLVEEHKGGGRRRRSWLVSGLGCWTYAVRQNPGSVRHCPTRASARRRCPPSVRQTRR